MRRWNERTPRIWMTGTIVLVVLLSLVLNGCGGAGGTSLTGDTSGSAGDLAPPGAITGEATGLVKSMPAQEPIAGVTVSIGARSDVTGTDGRYNITNIAPLGVYTVLCSAPGWTTAGVPPAVQILEGPNVLDDMFMVADGNVPPPPPPPPSP